MNDRKIREKLFHNKLRVSERDPHAADTRWSPALEGIIQSDPLWANMKYYSIERTSRDLVLSWYMANCEGKRVLDYCCGNGDDGLFIGAHGAKEVWGIDLSEVSIDNCKRKAEQLRLDNVVRYIVADAEQTPFPDGYFDIITEYGALHHLDLVRAFSEMARILRNDGMIICTEALGHNRIIRWYRRMTPHLRTGWEVKHIMCRRDFETARKYFFSVEMFFFHLVALLAVPFRRTTAFSQLLRVFERIDDFILGLPGIKWQAWQVVFILSKPR